MDITYSMHMSLSKLREVVDSRETWPAVATGSQRVGQDLAIEQQKYIYICSPFGCF